jgi:DNA-binding PadR family transcriptional regulator
VPTDRFARSDGLSEPGLLVLVSLTSGPKHGYAMIEDIESFARVRLGPGTLYGALERLEAAGLIEPLPSGERKQPYRISEAGLGELRGRVSALRRVTSAARQRLSLQAPE